MAIIVCAQDSVAPDECPECGGWLHAEIRGGYQATLRFCSEDCIESYQQHRLERDRVTHLHQRDLLCCCEVCAAAGHPTDSELAEWNQYQMTTSGEG